MTTHRFDPVSFVFGAVFVAVAAIGLIAPDLLSFTDLRWIAPGVLVVVGGLLLVRSGRASDDADGHGDAEEAAAAGSAAGPTPGAAGPDASLRPDAPSPSDGLAPVDAEAGDPGAPRERTSAVDTAVEGDDPER